MSTVVPQESSELVIGLVGPVGCNLQLIEDELEVVLKAAAYEYKSYRLSAILSSLAKLLPAVEAEPEFRRLWTAMEAGDVLRRLTERPEIMAIQAAHLIAEDRPAGEAGHRRAHVLRSLKRKEEVGYLRKLYGPRFVLVSVFLPRERRLAELRRMGMDENEATRLVVRDEGGNGEDRDHGQATSEAFELADLFVDAHALDLNKQLSRFFDLLLGSPFHTPSLTEHAMFLAYAASLRSGDLSRQVGAVVLAPDGTIVAEGCNDAPRYGGGPQWPDSADSRDISVGHDSNERIKLQIVGKLLNGISEESERARLERNIATSGILDITEYALQIADKLLNGVSEESERARLERNIATSGILDITEYGRAVHAEMSALTTCARMGVSTQGKSMYCTTFPCHNCAKHIVAAGIREVVFIEPYPKSRALELHDDSVSFQNMPDKVLLRPFVGVGPRRHLELFALRDQYGGRVKRKGSLGKRRDWDRRSAAPAVYDRLITYIELEQQASAELQHALAALMTE